MSSWFRSVAGIIAKSTAAVTKRHGGDIEELMRSVWPGRFGLNPIRKYRKIAKPHFEPACRDQIDRLVALPFRPAKARLAKAATHPLCSTFQTRLEKDTSNDQINFFDPLGADFRSGRCRNL